MSSGHVALPLGPSKAFLRDPRALRLGLKYAYIWCVLSGAAPQTHKAA